MNRIYALRWNASIRRWVVTSELARRHRSATGTSAAGGRKLGTALLSVSLFATGIPFAYAQDGAPGGTFNSANTMNNAGALIGGEPGTAANTGGWGALISGGDDHRNSGTIVGGGSGAVNGNAGSGVFLSENDARLENTATGRISGANGGSGRSGGHGIVLTATDTMTLPARVRNSGTITGGNSGGAGQPGGNAIRGTNAAVSNTGVITGGQNADGSRANAIVFTGGVNSLTLNPGGVINGNVTAFSREDTLYLAGTGTAGTLNAAEIGDTAKYRGFGNFFVLTSNWTLTGTTTAVTPWDVLVSSLTVDSDGALGASSGTLTLMRGTLRVTGDTFNSTARRIELGAGLGGGAFDIVSPTNTFTISQVLTGSDTEIVEKRGAGTLVYTGNNTYTGGTTISGGTLRLGNGGTTGGVVGNIVNNAALVIDRSNAYTLGGGMSGTGSLTQAGTGVTTVTTAQTYTGGTTISGGTLQLGNGGTAGSVVGNIVNNAALIVDRSNAFDLTGTISGTGKVTQAGTGTTTLIADNTYTGGTTISGGALQLGNGGTTGGVVGDIANDGALVLDRSNAVAMAGVISGTGSVTQAGAGTTTLTGANRYTGATNVAAGSLLVNGDQRLATGATRVAGGAALGGAGVIGGDVAVASGATLAPGAPASAPGTLTIAGDLSLADGAVLDYQFGQAGTVGGPLNDLTVVEGDLVLDGRLDVTASPGGVFGAGLYRVISYGGALTDNGLALGTMLNSAQLSVQTSIANQVNLVNAAGLTANFWDGNAGGRNDGAVSGGDGTWQARTGNDNWTDADGTLNAPHDSGAFAIFAGAAGTVEVDNSQGDVVAGGMQFATDGYRVQGDALTLVDEAEGGVTIRVGDGTTAGAGYSATVDAVLQGDVGVVKTDAGTLVLGGANTYAGGTTIAGGTVAISNDGNLGAATGGVTLDGGTLRALADLESDRAIAAQAGGATLDTQTHSVTLGGAIDGPGALTKTGAGTLTLTADNGYTGGTTISAGTLQLGDGGTTGHIVGDIVNNGTLAIDRSDAVTLAGAMSGTGHLTQMGAGTTVLTGANTHTGGTTISAGTVQVGDGGTSGSLAGDIVNNAALVIDRADAVTLAGAISGTGHLTQAGTGTTVLTGDNTYTGGTTISAGTLQLGDGGTIGSLVGNVANAGTLVFDRSDAVRFDGVVSGTGSVRQDGAGRVTFGGGNAYTGVTEVASGLLQAAMANAFSANSRHEVASGSTLDLAGYDQTVAGLHNAGTVSLMGATPGTTLTVRGDYVGDGGVLRMSAALGDSSSPTDRLVIDGGVVSGRTAIELTNREGLGAQTTGDGIELVRAINGATTTAQTTKDGFALVGEYVEAGAFEYRLHAADAAGLGENWYLRSTNRGETPLFASLNAQLRESASGMLGNLHQRLGDATMGSGSESAGYRQSWGRLVSIDRSLKQGGDATPSSRGRQNGLQIGSDVWAGGNWHVGAYFGTLAGEMQVEGSARGSTNLPVGRTDLDQRFAGLYATFQGENGFYVDTVLQGGRTRYKLIPTLGDMVAGDGDSRTVSVEVGRAFPIGRDWQIEPQLQLLHQRLSNDDVQIANALVQQETANSLTARAGMRLKGAFETGAGLLQPYTRVNYYRTRSDEDVSRFIGPSATADIVTPTGGRSSELAMGGTLSVNREVSLFGEVNKLWAHGDQSRARSDDLSANVGVKVGW
ncbi:hypothetical protein BEN78_09690 [Xanthomonas citri pv. mangiferaeindicae]|nr:hypothetical protein BEN78_09690 [Xanthomonas citri pv. mangiferaeindicae]